MRVHVGEDDSYNVRTRSTTPAHVGMSTPIVGWGVAAEDIITVDLASFNSLPQTVFHTAITAEHVAVMCAPGTPVSQVGAWTVTTGEGFLTVSGSISGSTTLKLVLVKSGTFI